MFCPNCGVEIKNPEVFCPNCGARLNPEMGKTPVYHEHTEQTSHMMQGETPKHRPEKSGFPKGILIVPVALAAAVAAFFVYNSQKDVIDLNKYYTLTIDGYDGSGRAELTFDSDKFEKKYKGKFSLDKKNAEDWVKKYVSSDYVEEMMDSLTAYDAAESISDALEEDFYEISPSEDLSNGQTITFESNEEIQEALELLYGCKIKNLKDYKVEGLKEVDYYDPFENLTVTFKGTDGSGSAELKTPDDKIGKQLKYTVEDDGSLTNGQSVEISIDHECNDFVDEYSTCLKRKSYTVTVEGLAAPTPTPVPSPTPAPTSAPAAETSAEAAPVVEGPALRSDFYKDGQLTGTDPNYIIPDSLDRVLTYDDISNLSAKGLSYARNEMMARMGRAFKNQELANYFRSTSWYSETISADQFDSQPLPSIVEANAALMKAEELKMGGGQLYIQ